MPKRSRRRRKGRSGEGSIWEREDGRWGWALMKEGVRSGGTCRTEEDAEAALEAVVTGGAAVQKERQNQTLSSYLDFWLKESVLPFKAPNSTANYRQMCEQHIKPALGHKKLKEVKPEDVQALINAVSQKKNRDGQPLSPKTVRNVKSVLARAMNQAVTWGRIKASPVRDVQLPLPRKFETRPFTEEEAVAFLETSKSDPYHIAFVIALSLGLRKSEILSLEWRDIDFETRRMHVRGTKTAGANRRLAMPVNLANALRRYRAEWLERRLQVGPEDWKAGERLIVAEVTHAPLCSRTLSNHFYYCLERGGHRRIRFHDLRHTCATLRLLRGEQITEVSRLLGHARISLTLDVYSHVLEGREEAGAERMNSLLDGIGG